MSAAPVDNIQRTSMLRKIGEIWVEKHQFMKWVYIHFGDLCNLLIYVSLTCRQNNGQYTKHFQDEEDRLLIPITLVTLFFWPGLQGMLTCLQVQQLVKVQVISWFGETNIWEKATAEILCTQCLKNQPFGLVCSIPSYGGLSIAEWHTLAVAQFVTLL
ncbi:uncharacterized protein LOC132182452 isoform X1 [Corylus avellana]|uniref:uncharacterized protein LOC132182452 isoform X1 n=1 Tax=Corylus avellana TaxID=13451 RepID=UPI00286B2DF5|nr:uncharacterized protein LOC132182452 isoform X1 [Corylus avellana]XP_059451684.1 uncharacterized protein LOC132182452 isoform X1 [Corylus avellana]